MICNFCKKAIKEEDFLQEEVEFISSSKMLIRESQSCSCGNRIHRFTIFKIEEIGESWAGAEDEE